MKVNANRGIIWKQVKELQSKPVGEPIFHSKSFPGFLVWFLITGEGARIIIPIPNGTSPIFYFSFIII